MIYSLSSREITCMRRVRSSKGRTTSNARRYTMYRSVAWGWIYKSLISKSTWQTYICQHNYMFIYIHSQYNILLQSALTAGHFIPLHFYSIVNRLKVIRWNAWWLFDDHREKYDHPWGHTSYYTPMILGCIRRLLIWLSNSLSLASLWAFVAPSCCPRAALALS